MKEKFCSRLCIFNLVILLLHQGHQIKTETDDTEKRLGDLSSSEWNTQPCDPAATDEPCRFNNTGDEHDIKTRTKRHSPGYCRSGWYTFGEKCYKSFGLSPYSRKSWNEAVDSCRLEIAGLVSIHNAEEQEFLKILLMEIRDDTWIGLRRMSSSEFFWKDSSPLDFTNWYEGEPNNLGGQEGCTLLRYADVGLGQWNDAVCRSGKPFICQTPKDRSLTQPGQDPGMCTQPNGWLKLRTSCYKIFEKTSSYSSWSQAESFCKSYEGNLVYVKNAALSTLLRLNLQRRRGPFWIGIKSTRKHKYTRLGEDVPLVYSNWKSDEPAELEDEQNCVAIDSQGEWVVRDCDEKHPLICEVSEEGPAAPTMEPYHQNMTCPYSSPRWHDLGGRYCYIIELNANTNWHEASCLCAEEGGYLASFHSTNEINVLLHYVKHHDNPLHIGFERDKRGNFVWSDGSPTDFTNWNRGEPNDLNEQCTEIKISTGRWNDIPCAAKHGYICSSLKVPERNDTVTSNGTASKRKDKSSSAKTHVIAIGVSLTLTAFVAAITAIVLYHFRSAKTDNATYSELQ